MPFRCLACRSIHCYTMPTLFLSQPCRCGVIRHVTVRFLSMPSHRRAWACQSKPLLCSARTFSVLQFIAFADISDAYLALPLRVKALLCHCRSLLRRAIAVHFVSWRIHAVAKPRLVPRSDAFAYRCHAFTVPRDAHVALPCRSCAVDFSEQLCHRFAKLGLAAPRLALASASHRVVPLRFAFPLHVHAFLAMP